MAFTTDKFILPDGSPSGSVQAMASSTLGPADLWDIGFFNYNDTATATTPIVIPATSAWVALTNDELGSFTNKTYSPSGVTDVWDAATGKFDFTELSLGDQVEIRLDMDFTTSVANQEYDVALNMAQSPGTPYDLFFVSDMQIKTSGTVNKVFIWMGIYMGDANTLDNSAQFRVRSASAGTVKVNGWYCKITKRGRV